MSIYFLAEIQQASVQRKDATHLLCHTYHEPLNVTEAGGEQTRLFLCHPDMENQSQAHIFPSLSAYLCKQNNFEG